MTLLEEIIAAVLERAAAHVDAGIYMGSDGKGNVKTKPMTGAFLRAIPAADLARELVPALFARTEATEAEIAAANEDADRLAKALQGEMRWAFLKDLDDQLAVERESKAALRLHEARKGGV